MHIALKTCKLIDIENIQHDKKCIQEFRSTTVSAGYMSTTCKGSQFSSLLAVARSTESPKSKSSPKSISNTLTKNKNLQLRLK